jgi:serine/threonine protein kinase
MDFSYYIDKTLGKCKITRLIGVGGMAWVFLARHQDLGVQRAIKVLKPVDDSLDANRKQLLIDRFVREARVSANLHNKNIIKIHDVGSFENTYYIEMEYLKGKSLRQFIADFEGFIPEDVAASIIYLCSDAINYAHKCVIAYDNQEIRGVIHRDIKPDNIYITEAGELKLLDFGIAKLSNISLTTSTEARNVTGTLAYMSPEQIDGKKVEASSDIFSLGIVYYELLLGRNPFLAEQMATTVRNISTCAYENPVKKRPGLHPAFNKILSGCLKYNPSDRFDSASEIRDLAFKILYGNGISNVDDSFREFITTGNVTTQAPPAKRRKWAAFAALLLAFLAVAYFAFNVFRPEKRPAPILQTVMLLAPAQVIKPAPAPEPPDTVRTLKKAEVQVFVRPKIKPKPTDSLAEAVSAGDLERALGYLLRRPDPAMIRKYAESFPTEDQVYFVFQGLQAYFSQNYPMAASYLETALRKPTRFSGHRLNLIEVSLYYKAKSYSILFHKGDSAAQGMAVSSWNGLIRVCKNALWLKEAGVALKEIGE